MLARIVSLFLMALTGLFTWAWMDYQAFVAQPIISENSKIIEIEKGSSFVSIIQALGYQGRSFDMLWFRLLAEEEGLINQLKAGEYELSVDLLPKDFLVLLSLGRTRQHEATFPEGWRFKEIRQALTDNTNIAHTITELSDLEILQKLGSDYTHPEGLFFPDTYSFEKNTSDLAILKLAYNKMQLKLASLWEQRAADLPLKSAYDALTLASIVEKETGLVSEQPIIAGVFMRRLQKGMRLQTDPTVIYGMGDSYQGNIRKKDLGTLTPYNTYRINGLPPTPIAMPGEYALYSVLHPEDNGSLYFVAKGDGSHIFSSTLAEHNQSVNTFQRKHK
ncbi:MAG: endolytic transglycosylase MltG [Methylococcaceae bacterium]|nr:endolytic transglycosylase MltG [Methylococcaceae bacterium]